MKKQDSLNWHIEQSNEVVNDQPPNKKTPYRYKDAPEWWSNEKWKTSNQCTQLSVGDMKGDVIEVKVGITEELASQYPEVLEALKKFKSIATQLEVAVARCKSLLIMKDAKASNKASEKERGYTKR